MDCRIKPGNDEIRDRFRDVGQLGPPAIIIEHEDADRRGQITAATGAVDDADQLGQALPSRLRDLFERSPERIFDADAGLVARDDDRALDHRRFHIGSLP